MAGKWQTMAGRGRPKGSGTNATSTLKVGLIRDMHALGFNAAQIQEKLGTHSPPDRTVRSIIQREAVEDHSGAWSLTDGIEPITVLEDVLRVLRAIVRASEGRRSFLTKREAGYVAQLATAAPDLSPIAMFRLARLYLKRGFDKQGTEDLDVYLALAPWRDEESAKAYADVLRHGRVPTAPVYLAGVPKGDRDYDNPENRRRRIREVRDFLDIDSGLYDEGDTSG